MTEPEHMGRMELIREVARLREAAEWAYQRALRIAEPAYTQEGAGRAAQGIVERLRKALDA